jgi:hypothetical protein
MTNPISQRNLWLRSALAATTVLAAASGLAVACSSSTTTIPPSTDSGTDTGTTSDTGTKETGTKDSGTKDGATKDTGSTTLYERLGKHAGIRSAVDAIVAQELTNADIASYFFFQAGAPGNGHPTAADVEECFTDLVASAIKGPGEVYPATVETIDGSVVTVSDAGADAGDSGTFYVCRGDMSVVHAPLLISGGTFDKFVAIAAAELAVFDDGGIAAADIATLGTALESFKTVIVEDGGLDTGLQAFPGNLDGGDGG